MIPSINKPAKIYLLPLIILLLTASFTNAQTDPNFNPDTVKAQKFDTGKMWTFDYPPVEYFDTTYNFKPDEQWLEHVRLSALRIPGCTSSFISSDGLMMTNLHCSTFHFSKVEKEGEDFEETGFYAKTLDEERKIPGMYADQLVFTKDVTEEVQEATEEGGTDEEKAEKRQAKIEELQKNYEEETGLTCQVVSLYNGGKYSVYGYKRYNDIRLVFSPESQIGFFGGDYDNFTYPRYNLDFSLLRAYDEDGNPVKTDNYFKWSENGAPRNDVVFTIGNPGTTNRLKTVAQLKYYRDITYRNLAYTFNGLYKTYTKLRDEFPDRRDEFENLKNRVNNAQKVFDYTYKGLTDPYLMARKQAFEDKLKEKVNEDPELKEKYGHIWDVIANLRNEMMDYGHTIAAFNMNPFTSSKYFEIAQNVIEYAEQMQKPEEEREPVYMSDKIDSVKNAIYPEDFEPVVEKAKLAIQIGVIEMNLGKDDELVNKIFDGYEGKEAVDYVINKSSLTSKEKVEELLNEDPEDILNSDDPFIYFVMNSRDKLAEAQKLYKEVQNTEQIYDDMVGQVLFHVYGTSIPPDANFTLRISDGVMKSYDYNGTKAPTVTTFYGLLDRYYGWFEEYPWNLPEKWQDIPEDFDLTTPFDFISTNDIVGGNSGSPVINRKGEIVGIAFDGNKESIKGNFIFMPFENRCVSVSSQAMLESLDKIYKADRIVEELKTGKIEK